jgi:hypothetical protein
MLVYNNYNGLTISVLLRGDLYIATIFELGKTRADIADILMSPASLGEEAAFAGAQQFIDAQALERTQH